MNNIFKFKENKDLKKSLQAKERGPSADRTGLFPGIAYFV
jgi:hypothetical protein